MSKFIGRKEEIRVLEEALASPEVEMVSIIGRRRVGKTFLVKHVYGGQIDFEASGLQKAPLSEQLQNFSLRLNETFFEGAAVLKPANWLDAFHQLSAALDRKKKEGRMVVFLDELPWFDSHKSGFLRGLSYFWNSWAVNRDIVVVICGSSASWMIQNVLRNKGGLHNRVTKRIRLKPFSLAETEEYLAGRGIVLDRYHILLIYMALGGIPHYLKEVAGHMSATQNINQICFSEGGLLKDEFLSLYPALFSHSDYHLSIIRALAGKHYGMVRGEVVRTIPFPDGGRVTKVLQELIESGFVSEYFPFGKKKKEKVFRLSDEYSLFYLRFIEQHPHDEEDIWNMLSQTQEFKTWCGYAFENICLKHIPQIKKALGISGIYSSVSTFVKTGSSDGPGTQVDLLIDRNDRVINLVEIKFYSTALTLTKADSDALREKLRVFRESTGTKKLVNWVMLSTFGVKPNAHSLGSLALSLDMDCLFVP
ncbi:MAG: ATP-binding protein [Saprospiraceae bacterium]|nr:ATP-binding protein [Saprospiraceae bacterium]MCF8249644.1 ATP-binding protein [Saprospiraceae bacterium]MCF8280454.1 ATP-binding protein [Bacteroidales bacterium]MCF8310476.1 ATP-binding protein [Saprospiraceae bacterium]MCF8439854.1 ATP-binding protein [Saprospiraceae bacterium]